MTPDHSVIIPMLNGAAHIGECLDSALPQLGPEDEVLVIDNGSTDGSPELVLSYRDPRVQLLAEPKRGPAAARNAGLRLARGHYVTFLDCDDAWAPGRITAMRAAVEGTPGANAAYGRIRVRYDNGPDPIHFGIDGQHVSTWGLWSYMFERRLLDQVGPLEESLQMGEDTDYILRLRRAGMNCAVCDAIVSIYRRHTANMTNDRAEVQRSFMRTLLRNAARLRAARQ